MRVQAEQMKVCMLKSLLLKKIKKYKSVSVEIPVPIKLLAFFSFAVVCWATINFQSERWDPKQISTFIIITKHSSSGFGHCHLIYKTGKNNNLL